MVLDLQAQRHLIAVILRRASLLGVFFGTIFVGGKARAEGHAGASGGGSTPPDSCDNIAEKVCRTSDSSAGVAKAEALSEKMHDELDRMVVEARGPDWRKALLGRLAAEGFSPSPSLDDPRELDRFFAEMYQKHPFDKYPSERLSEGANIWPFRNTAVDACDAGPAGDVDAQLISLWTSSGGPSTNSLGNSVLGLVGKDQVRFDQKAKLRAAIAKFAKSPVALRFNAVYDEWGTAPDLAAQSRDFLAAYKDYLAKEHDFYLTERQGEIESLAKDERPRLLRAAQICAIRRALGDSGACYGEVFDTVGKGLFVRRDVSSGNRLEEKEVVDLEKLLGGASLDLTGLKEKLDLTLFPKGIPDQTTSAADLVQKLLADGPAADLDLATFVEPDLEFAPDSVRTGLCSEMQYAAAARLRQVINDFHQDLQISKPFLKKARDMFYPPAEVASQKIQFEAVKSLVREVMEKQLLPQVNDPSKRSAIRNSFSKVRLALPMPVDELPFITKSGGKNPVLDVPQTDLLPPSSMTFYSMLLNPNFDALNVISAEYTYEMQSGVEREEREVFVNPALRIAFADRPATMISTIAHEIGHNFDPRISKLNGHDLGPTLKKLMDCLRKSRALGMQDGQEDECLADWVSAEAMAVLADNASRRTELGLPSKDYDFASQMVSIFCYFQDQYPGGSRAEVHPRSSRRINGIFGAQPRLREAFGCPARSPSYCRLDGASK